MTAGKSWTGRIVEGNDKNKDGKPIKQRFRAYDSIDDYVKDEI
jgi:flagellum-specific peptidoglycan hydrolase FlgJ